MPKAINITVGEYKQSADQMIEHLRSLGVHISKEEAQQIFEDIRRHPKEIADGLRKAVEAAK